ncbi:NADH-ubiquinone oxidoreductase 78 kDa subunit [Trichoderma lentiforme]|uniref:NADH-ubiquinone oxidoreductase 78 kDa subunit, mitochondrial n=1 Tax=Trichoderma lentiforme TaxID=1567552 RepID=A0A9P5CB76_9HYPO|nr:NADH-ubiquinone oxidoreductase 78 kDa subunit [Trichoderma lentiforme]
MLQRQLHASRFIRGNLSLRILGAPSARYLIRHSGSTRTMASSGKPFEGVSLDDLPKSWNFTASLPPDQAFPTPADSHKTPRDKILPRQVRDALFTWVRPVQQEDPELLAVSPAALRDIGIKEGEEKTEDFRQLVAGNKLYGWDEEKLEGGYPWAQCYGGFQFGQWAGQLGDGRAISLFEATNPASNVRYELQLKGAGLTPYSRFADGKAVLRSSLREFVVSEALNALNIPTTRALSLTLLPHSKVRRETTEPGAIVLRFAQSWLRLGTFDIMRARGDRALIRKLATYIAEDVFGGWETLPGRLESPEDPKKSPPPKRGISASEVQGPSNAAENRFQRLYREIVRRNAVTVAHWQAYGFMNGVLNTDNTSVYGLSMDYGPFAFMDNFDPSYTPNHDDHMLRYNYKNQPTIIWWNLVRLGEALGELVGIGAQVDDETFVNKGIREEQEKELVERAENLITQAGEEYKTVFLNEYKRLMTARIGLRNFKETDFDELFSEGLDTMEALELDFNHFFRRLGTIKLADIADPAGRKEKAAIFFHKEGPPQAVSADDAKERIAKWLEKWRVRVLEDWGSESSDALSEDQDAERRQAMKQVNPNFVPRGWILDEVIRRVEKEGEREVLNRITHMALHPFEDSWDGVAIDGVERAAAASRAFATTPRRAAEVELTIAGSALIQACEKAGATVPRKLMIAGNCRMCLVEVEKAPKPVASCAWPVQPGMVVKTNSPLTHKAREGVMEFLLANHPLDCPICDQGGECDLQDQSMRYGADRGRFHEIGGKRAVEDKNIGPLIKTSMNRCIHCTRCVRFANDIAGAPEMGSTGRGNDLQIGTYLEKNLDSEMSGNIIDHCPVGALTSKPYAFRARPWELKHTESIDVLDGLGSNIRVDSRGLEVMRVLPRLNDDVNEEWINDKTRFACDGLKTQRLTVPLIKREGKFETADWEEALTVIAKAYQQTNPQGNEFKVIAGALTEVESLVVAKDMANKLGSENLALDTPTGSQPLAHGVDVRSNYLFNSKIWGIEESDCILIVGSNPRHEAAVLNARIRKQWLRSDLEIGVVGETWESTFEFEHLGADHAALKKALAGPFGKKLQAAKKPMIIVGSGVTDHVDAKAFYETVGTFVNQNAANFRTAEWDGYNVLQREASRAGAFEVGFVTPSAEVAQTKPKFVWLLGADEVNEADIPKDAFVVYQGHHGDRGAQIADIVLPGAAYTEKAGTYINTEGRVQMTRAATSLPGAARTDWKILRAASEFLGAPLPYDDVAAVRDRMIEISPALAAYDVVEPVALKELSKVQLVEQNKGAKASNQPLKKVIENFYFTDVISRSSPTMARCSAAKTTGDPRTNFMAPGMEEDRPMGQVAYGA